MFFRFGKTFEDTSTKVIIQAFLVGVDLKRMIIP